jgi:hypothetical protein
MSSNDYATLARYRKAERLADVIETFNGTAADVEAMAVEGRRMAEQLAMVRVASDTTWALVVEVLRSRARARQMVPADPFSVIR